MKIVFSDMERVIIQQGIWSALRFIEMKEGKKFRRKDLAPYRRIYRLFVNRSGLIELRTKDRKLIHPLLKISKSLSSAMLDKQHPEAPKEVIRKRLVEEYGSLVGPAFESAIRKLSAKAKVTPQDFHEEE